MMLEPVRRCDVFGTKKDVRPVTITISHSDESSETSLVLRVTKDLSGRALKRAIRLVEKATTPPRSKEPAKSEGDE